MIYVNKIEKTITFKIKAGYHLERLRPETITLLGITKSKITKDENGENGPHLETTEVALVRCNIVNNDYHHWFKSLVYICSFLINHLVNY